MASTRSPEAFFEAKLPDYEGEGSWVMQICVLMAILWLFVLPAFFSQPLPEDHSEGTNPKPTAPSVSSSTTETSKGGKKGRKTRINQVSGKNGPSGNTQAKSGGSSSNMNARQETGGHPSSPNEVARYIPLWANLVCIAGFCGSVVYILFALSPYNYYTPRRVFQAPLFTPEECQHVIDMAARAAERNVLDFHADPSQFDAVKNNETHPLLVNPVGWQKTRHGIYPTTDLNFVTDPFTKQDREWLSDILNRRLAPSLERFFGYPPAAIRMNDLFVVRYDADKRAHLDNHTDDADISFNVLLTDNFEGGGTRFWNRNLKQPFAHVQPTQVGTFLTHGSQINHEGYHVSEGTRMILVGFTSIDRFDPWTGQSTGLSWLASWFSLSWAHIRFRAGWRHNAQRAQEGERAKFYDGQFFRLLFRDVINILESIGDVWLPHAVTRVVHPANATAYLESLDTEYYAKGQYRPKANWFKGQNVDLDVDGTIEGEWKTRTKFESRFAEL